MYPISLKQILIGFSTVLLFTGCSSDTNSEEKAIVNTSISENIATPIPVFNADSAYGYIARQVNFGPRIPGSEAQELCADWMELHLRATCDTVYRQQTIVTAGDGITPLRCINLVGVINPAATQRILLLAHWDTRPWADQDITRKDQPIDGADDGASGVGVLLELARVIRQHPLPENLGIDILLTDVEDWGKTEWGDKSYALGTQYWARNPHIPGYTAQAGILLDMVGAANARFTVEGYSQRYAHQVITQVWNAAEAAGFGRYFVYESGGEIIDDHVPINEIARIPTIDIINLPASSHKVFPAHWHTHQDNLGVIDTQTLKAVGQTLLHYLYTLKTSAQ